MEFRYSVNGSTSPEKPSGHPLLTRRRRSDFVDRYCGEFIVAATSRVEEVNGDFDYDAKRFIISL